MLDRSPATAQHEAYRYLRDQILTGALGADDLIKPDNVAQMLGISRMPVREALRQLDSEGLVLMRPNRSAVVTRLTGAELRDLFQMRAELEALAVRDAVLNLTDENKAELQTLRQRMDRVQNAPAEWIARHDDLHHYICQLSGRRRLTQEIHRIRQAVRPFLSTYIKEFEGFEMRGLEHSTLIETIVEGDPDIAAEMMRQHVSQPIAELTHFYESRGANKLSDDST